MFTWVTSIAKAQVGDLARCHAVVVRPDDCSEDKAERKS
jgi:hypothetical protein